jgi:ketosteroid isomerase-like protein
MRRHVSRAAIAAFALSIAARSAPAQQAETDIVAAANRFFAAMLSRDTAALHAMIAPDLTIVASVAPTDASATGPAVRRQTGTSFLASIAASKVDLHERMWAPEVRVDGAIAILWAPYDFHRGTEFSHCGHDTFQFAHENGHWVVTALAYTVQRTGCPPPSG